MYDPTMGRWISPDPIGFHAGDEDLYRYVFNNPTNGTDPSGLLVPEWLGPAAGTIGLVGSSFGPLVAGSALYPGRVPLEKPKVTLVTIGETIDALDAESKKNLEDAIKQFLEKDPGSKEIRDSKTLIRCRFNQANGMTYGLVVYPVQFHQPGIRTGSLIQHVKMEVTVDGKRRKDLDKDFVEGWQLVKSGMTKIDTHYIYMSENVTKEFKVEVSFEVGLGKFRGKDVSGPFEIWMDGQAKDITWVDDKATLKYHDTFIFRPDETYQFEDVLLKLRLKK